MTQHEEKEKFFREALSWAERKGFHTIKASFGDFERPKSFKSLSMEYAFSPDMSAIKRTHKNYFEIGLKADDGVRRIATRWKLLATLAAREGGKLYILAPRGHRSFVQGMIDQYKLNSQVVSI